MRVAVTGANGKVGRAVVAELLKHTRYAVVAVAHRSVGSELAALAARPPFRPQAKADVALKRADLTDYGQTVCALDGADAVIHLAAIPNPPSSMAGSQSIPGGTIYRCKKGQ